MMNIGQAIEAMRSGQFVARRGWNGNGMHLFITADGVCGNVLGLEPFVVMKTEQGDFIPWNCSQAELLAQDWEVVRS